MLWPEVAKGLAKVDFSCLMAVADYQWPLSHLLTALKFSARLPHAKVLAELFYEHHQNEELQGAEAIIPIPLHKNRFFFRKYNQSLEIARHLSRFSGIPLQYQYLRRQKNTKAQTELSAAQRRNNLRHAFVVPSHYHALIQNMRHIILFDDVVTTGTTVNSAYLALKKINPQLRIDICCICVAVKHLST